MIYSTVLRCNEPTCSSGSAWLRVLRLLVISGFRMTLRPDYSQLMTTQIQPRAGIDRCGPFLIVFGVWFLAFVVFFFRWLLSSATVVGNPCRGAGFACFETDRQGIEFLGFLIGLPVTFGWLVLGLVVTSLVGMIKNMRWWWKGLLSLGICLALATAIVAIIIQVR